MKICFRCKKPIEDKGDFYSFNTYEKGELVKVDYAHKKCWDEFLNNVKDATEAKSMLKDIKPVLQKMGLIKEEEYVLG